MKTFLTKLLAAALWSATLGAVIVGCAGTATSSSTGEYIDDSAITAKVKAAMVQDPTVKARDVKVETFKGVVQLSGFVDSQNEKARAEQIAAGVAGVQSVQNNITVK